MSANFPLSSRHTSNQDRWAAALDDWAHVMARGRLAESTIARVRKQVRRFATDTGLAPFDVTRADVTAWDDELDCSKASRYAYRTSLRTFYRWALAAGRIDQDPTDTSEPHPLAQPIPAVWVEPLRAYRRWLRAGGATAATVTMRSEHLGRLGRESGLAPFDLTEDDLADWVAGHRWARETTRAVRSSLRSFYTWAATTGRVAENPAEHLPIVRASAPSPRPASERQYRDAVAVADHRAGLMVRLSAELGLRRGEVAHVHSRDLYQDGQGGWWLTVHGKGDRVRRLPLTVELAALLRARPDGWVFPGRDGGHLSPRYVGKLVSDLLPAGVTMHTLRHRFATRAYGVNRDVFAVQRFLGHASPATTQRYVATGDETARALVEAVAAR